MKGSHAEAGLKKLYMAKTGCSRRTAQLHAQNRHPDYVAFLASVGMEAVKVKDPSTDQKQALVAVMRGPLNPPGESSPDSEAAPPAMAKPASQWTPEEYAECQAWQGLVLANRQRDHMLKQNDPHAAAGYVQLAATSLKAYHMARAKRVQAEIESGRLKPMAAWDSAKNALMKVVALFGGLKGDLAQAANPEKPHLAAQGISQWEQQKWNPALELALSELDAGLLA